MAGRYCDVLTPTVMMPLHLRESGAAHDGASPSLRPSAFDVGNLHSELEAEESDHPPSQYTLSEQRQRQL